MNPRRTSRALAASLALLAPVAAVLAQSEAAADKWYKIAISGNEVAFVNENSIQRVGNHVQVRVKQNYAGPGGVREEGQDLPVGTHRLPARLRAAQACDDGNARLCGS